MDRHCIRIGHLELGKKFATLGPAVRTAGFRDAQFLGCMSNRLVNHSQHFADLSLSLSLSLYHARKQGPRKWIFFVLKKKSGRLQTVVTASWTTIQVQAYKSSVTGGNCRFTKRNSCRNTSAVFPSAALVNTTKTSESRLGEQNNKYAAIRLLLLLLNEIKICKNNRQKEKISLSSQTRPIPSNETQEENTNKTKKNTQDEENEDDTSLSTENHETKFL